MEYIDTTDGSATLEIRDGENIVVNITTDQWGAVGIALSASDALALARDLITLAAGI